MLFLSKSFLNTVCGKVNFYFSRGDNINNCPVEVRERNQYF